MFLLPLRFFPSLLLLLSSASVAGEGFVEYCNGRFAFCVQVPKGLAEMPAPENDDGRTWKAGSGGVVRAWGMWNALDETLSEACAADGSALDTVVLDRVHEDWCVVSGYRKGRIVYQKRQFAQGRWVVLRLDYEGKERSWFDGRIKRMAKSVTLLPMPDAP